MKIVIAIITINLLLILWNYAAHKFDDIKYDSTEENEPKNKNDR